MKVRTGDKPSANSDADINLEIFGKTGSTGPRSLRKLSKDPDELFQLVSYSEYKCNFEHCIRSFFQVLNRLMTNLHYIATCSKLSFFIIVKKRC